MARKSKALAPLAHALLNPLNINLDLSDGGIRLGNFRRYDKFDAMRDEERREQWNSWWDKKSDGEKKLWVGGGFGVTALFLYLVIRTR